MKDYAFVGVALLAVVAPFETTAPLVRLPGQSISDVEAALLVAFLVWGAGMLMWRALPEWRTPLTAPWIALLVVCAVASLSSQISRVNALHMTGRLGAAFGVYLLTANGVTTRDRLRLVLSLVLAIGVVVALLACFEYLQWPRVLRALSVFRPGLTTVGAQVRAGGSLQYPTIASMYLEIVFAFGVGLLLIALDAGERAGAAITFGALMVVAEGITVTYTRAGLITMAATLVIAAVARLRVRGLDTGVRLVGALAIGVTSMFVASRSVDSLWLRLTTEGQESWYRATIDAPPAITLATGSDQIVPVSVTNTGRLVWDSGARPPIYFSYHWMSPAGDRVVTFDGVRTPFDAPVDPGQTAEVRARVRAPRQPGDYRLVWDVVQEGRLWFTTEPGAVVPVSRATVDGDPAAAPAPTFAPPKITVRPGRFQLWRAAVAMFAAHPIFGVGPDNFRLSYGRYAGISTPDTRTHSNNMYLEILAGTGIAGALVLAWLGWSARGFISTNIGIACAVVAIALHGVVDSFLSFAPTYILFAMTLGLATGDWRLVTDENRV